MITIYFLDTSAQASLIPVLTTYSTPITIWCIIVCRQHTCSTIAWGNQNKCHTGISPTTFTMVSL